MGLKDRRRLTLSSSLHRAGNSVLELELAGTESAVERGSRLRIKAGSLVFSFKLNLKALFFTSGEENIGGLLALAELGPGPGAELRRLPGDSG